MGRELEKSQRLEAGHAVTGGDQVVVDADAKGASRLDNLAGHVDVGGRRRRIARGVIVQEPTELGKLRGLLRKLPDFRIAGDVDWGALATVPSIDTVPSVLSHSGSPRPTVSAQLELGVVAHASRIPSPAPLSRPLTARRSAASHDSLLPEPGDDHDRTIRNPQAPRATNRGVDSWVSI